LLTSTPDLLPSNKTDSAPVKITVGIAVKADRQTVVIAFQIWQKAYIAIFFFAQ
jgi:hypothetical protein